jgi:hypothetical protein
MRRVSLGGEFIELLHAGSTSLPYTLHRMEFWSWEAHWEEEDTLDGHSDNIRSKHCISDLLTSPLPLF